MDFCNVYINEKSMVSQCTNIFEVEESLKTIIDCLSLINGCSNNVVTIRKYYSQELFRKNLSRLHSLQNLSNKDLKMRFHKAIKDAKVWEREPLSDITANYIHDGIDVSWSSMSEAYEQQSTILINMMDSTIKEPNAVIEKRGNGIIMVDSYSNVEALSDFLIKREWKQKGYDLSSSIPPRDNETILIDTSIFKPTDYSFQGRVMYRRIGTNNLCYVDNKHHGIGAHIEEFNEITKKQVRKLKIDVDEEFKPLSTTEKERLLKFDRK